MSVNPVKGARGNTHSQRPIRGHALAKMPETRAAVDRSRHRRGGGAALALTPPFRDMARSKGAAVASSGAPPANVASLATQEPASPAAVYLASLAQGSRRVQRSALETAIRAHLPGQRRRPDIEHFEWSALGPANTSAILAALRDRFRLAPATCNRILAAVRGVLRQAWRLGLMPTERYLHAVDLKNVRAAALPRGRALTAEEVETLLAACTRDRSPAGARDAAAIAVLFGAGLRRQEAASLDLEHLDLRSGTVKVLAGKGRRARVTFLSDEFRAVVRWWVGVRGTAPGPLLVPVLKGGHPLFRRLTGDAIRRLLQRRAEAARVKAFTPHDCRRSCATSLLAAGADVLVVQRMLGHADPATTQRYDKRPAEAMRLAARLLTVRFEQPGKEKDGHG